MSGYRVTDRAWMTTAERLSIHEGREAGRYVSDVYYSGGGVYRVGWGVTRRGAKAARAWIEENYPEFAERVNAARAARPA